MRGTATDLVFFIVLAVTLMFSVMLVLYVNSTISGKIQTTLEAKGAPSEVTDVFTKLETFRGASANMVMFLVFAFMGVSLLMAYLTPNSKAFIFFAFLTFAGSIILALVGKSIFDMIEINNPALISNMPLASWFWSNSTIILSIYGGLLLFLTYYRSTQESG